MAKKADLELLAECLADAGSKLLSARASNIGEVNSLLQDVGNDLRKAAEGLNVDDDDQTTSVWNVTSILEAPKQTKRRRRPS